MKTVTISGTYGSAKTPCEILVARTQNESYWYAVKGSQIVNLTWHELNDGVDVEEIQDIDCFTWSEPIKSEKQLIQAIEA